MTSKAAEPKVNLRDQHLHVGLNIKILDLKLEAELMYNERAWDSSCLHICGGLFYQITAISGHIRGMHLAGILKHCMTIRLQVRKPL